MTFSAAREMLGLMKHFSARTGAARLLGGNATRANVYSGLQAMRQRGPDYFVFYFSGHGNDDGIALSDGLLHFRHLVPLIQAIDAPFSLVVLDACSAASYLDYVQRTSAVEGWGAPAQFAWLDAVAGSSPGCRLMFSTGASRSAAEGAGTANGHFTDAFLSAIRGVQGDISAHGYRWISDSRAFEATRKIMFERHGLEQRPVAKKLTGDFPLILSHVDEWRY